MKGKKSTFQKEETLSVSVSHYRKGKNINQIGFPSADSVKKESAGKKEHLQSELLGGSYPVSGKVPNSKESSLQISGERAPDSVKTRESLTTFEQKGERLASLHPSYVEGEFSGLNVSSSGERETDAGLLTIANDSLPSLSFQGSLLVNEEAGRSTLTKSEEIITATKVLSVSKKEESPKHLPNGVSKSKSVAGVELHQSKEGVVRKEKKHDILLSESRRDFQGVSQLQGVGDGAPHSIHSVDDVPLPSNGEVRHEIAKGENVSSRPATAETGRLQLTYWGFEQSSDSHEGSDNFHQESGRQNIQKQFPAYTFSLDLKNFSFRAGFTRNALSLSINFLNEQGVTPSLIEEIESVIRSSGIAFGRIQLKVKGKTVYSSSVKKEEVSLELRV
ncbi:hypothetical protein [Phorcysia thermohydrogeniphila]|uniref:hypothetical protein n=1 Tax=Phorcysia thermohydrogeniphila TaxID=936138 RepID=UPI001401FC92|nr:hypothetical protein [Phorcysia thermohydrogeniphila]